MREAWRSFLDEQSVATGSPESWSFFARSFFSYGKRSRFTDGKMGRKIAGRVCPPTVFDPIFLWERAKFPKGVLF